MQFRRQNRANIQAQRARTYKFEWKTVAKNRKKSMGQTDLWKSDLLGRLSYMVGK